MIENFENHEERMNDIDAFVASASQYSSVTVFLDSFSLDNIKTEKNSQLVLSTIHQAKGLEWDSVFLIAGSDGMLPLARCSDLEEERRLFYVAASRAKTRLVITCPLKSGKFYQFSSMSPSRFILEIPEECYDLQEFQ